MPRLSPKPAMNGATRNSDRIHTTVEDMILALQDVTDDDEMLVAAAASLLGRARRRPHLVRRNAA